MPAGVLIGAPAVVALGSIMLLAALASCAVGARALSSHACRVRAIAYHAVIATLAVSVVVGSALAKAV